MRSARVCQQHTSRRPQLQLSLDEDSSRSSHALIPPAPAVREPTAGRRLTLQLRADSTSSNSNSSSALDITAALQERQASESQPQPASSSVLQTTYAAAGRAAAVILQREAALQRRPYLASPAAAVAVAVPGVLSLQNSSNQKIASLSGPTDPLSVSALSASASRLQLALAGDSEIQTRPRRTRAISPRHSSASPSREALLRGTVSATNQ